MDSENKYLHIQPVTPTHRNNLLDRPMCRDNRSQEMGCPIRKFPDQSLFAAPRNLSQRTTSFIASQRQGIRRIPFRHLIVLEIRKRTIPASPSRARPNRTSSPPRQTRLDYVLLFEKTSFASNTSGIFAVRLRSRLVCSRLQIGRWAWNYSQTGRPLQGETGCASSSRCHGTNRTARNRTSVRSALRPLLSRSLSYPAEPCGFSGEENFKLDISSEAVFRQPVLFEKTLVEPDGIEPTTSCLQSTRSPN